MCLLWKEEPRRTTKLSAIDRGYGDRLGGVVAWLSGEHHQSYRMVKSMLANLFGVELSRGSINRLREKVSEAISVPVEQAQKYVQAQKFVHSDETGFSQGNSDGLNPRGAKGWLWTLVTPMVKVFSIVLSRSQASAQTLIGKTFEGIVISDRYSAYNWLDVKQRQICWAHLKRDLTAMAERTGVSKQIGEGLLDRESRLFRWWHRVRDGTMSREQFRAAVKLLREGFKVVLEAAAALPIGKSEKSPLAKIRLFTGSFSILRRSRNPNAPSLILSSSILTNPYLMRIKYL